MPITPGDAHVSPHTPPTQPGEIRDAHRAPAWPLVLGWLCVAFAIISLVHSAWFLAHPYLAAWLIEQAPGSHDDLSGGMRFYRIPDVALVLLRIAMAVWLLQVSRNLRRRLPGSVALLRRWCLLKLALEVLMVLVTYAQMSAHFGSRTEMSSQEAFWATFGMAVWTAITGFPLPMLVLAWLALPIVRKTEAAKPDRVA